MTVERPQPGKPHRGKVLAAIQPHCDDIPIFAGGAVLKLLDEGYTGILITLSNAGLQPRGPKENTTLRADPRFELGDLTDSM